MTHVTGVQQALDSYLRIARFRPELVRAELYRFLESAYSEALASFHREPVASRGDPQLTISCGPGQYAKMRSGMKFLVSIYQDEDGAYIAECPSIPGCVSQGQTDAEAESNITDAIRECLAVRAELGMPPTVTTREVEVLV